MKTSNIVPEVTIKPLHDSSNLSDELAYWQTQTPQARIEALELIRREYNSWKYPNHEPRLQRVYRIIKHKKSSITE